MTDNEITRHLGKNVMGWGAITIALAIIGLNNFEPITSIDDCARLEDALPEDKRCLYISKLRAELGLSYPISAFGQMDLYRIATATPRQRCLAMVEATR